MFSVCNNRCNHYDNNLVVGMTHHYDIDDQEVAGQELSRQCVSNQI